MESMVEVVVNFHNGRNSPEVTQSAIIAVLVRKTPKQGRWIRVEDQAVDEAGDCMESAKLQPLFGGCRLQIPTLRIHFS